MISLGKTILQSSSLQRVLRLTENVLTFRTRGPLFYLHLAVCCLIASTELIALMDIAYIIRISGIYFGTDFASLQVSNAGSQTQKNPSPSASLSLIQTVRPRGESRLISLCHAVCTTDLRCSVIRSESHWRFDNRLFSRVIISGLAASNTYHFQLVDSFGRELWCKSGHFGKRFHDCCTVVV